MSAVSGEPHAICTPKTRWTMSPTTPDGRCDEGDTIIGHTHTDLQRPHFHQSPQHSWQPWRLVAAT
eukprot:scaffold660347_cov39-Prasinocladus_malaysianus.AAC.1